MRKSILFGSALAVMFWGSILPAQNTNPGPTGDQTKIQKRNRVHTPDANGTQSQQGAMNRRGNNDGTGPNGKKIKNGPGDGTGNLGNRPMDGTGHGAKSGNRGGPMDGTGKRRGGRKMGSSGQMGSWGGQSTMGQSGGFGSSGRGRGGRGGGRR